MAYKLDIQTDNPDFDDIVPQLLTRSGVPHRSRSELEDQVQHLRSEVGRLREFLQDSLTLQQKVLKHFEQSDRESHSSPTTHQQIPMAASTPYTPAVSKEVHTPYSGAQGEHSSTPLHTMELSNTSRVIAAALHHAKLKLPVFAGDAEVHPEDWLQAVNDYRSSLNMTDTQILAELPHFLTREPSKWFKALSSHVVTWSEFCQFFRTVFLPSDNGNASEEAFSTAPKLQTSPSQHLLLTC